MSKRLVLSLAAATLVSATPAHAGARFHQPAVGSCHNYGQRVVKALSDNTRAVPCEGTHREVTVAVEMLPAGIRYRQERRLLRAVGPACYRAFYAALGGDVATRDLSAYRLAWYAPTRAERAHGAHWVRCDLFLANGFRPQRLPNPLLGSAPLPNSVARCSRRLLTTVCSARHAFRAVAVLGVATGRYPGERRLNRMARRRCRGKVGSKVYRWAYPLPWQWRAGDNGIVCFTRTRH
jgi:hypothetical protein